MIESICGSGVNCWNRERAILSGMQIKKRRGYKTTYTDYEKNGVVVYTE
jgi:hypothetical protein